MIFLKILFLNILLKVNLTAKSSIENRAKMKQIFYQNKRDNKKELANSKKVYWLMIIYPFTTIAKQKNKLANPLSYSHPNQNISCLSLYQKYMSLLYCPASCKLFPSSSSLWHLCSS